jgi:hypothetical protein
LYVLFFPKKQKRQWIFKKEKKTDTNDEHYSKEGSIDDKRHMQWRFIRMNSSAFFFQ